MIDKATTEMDIVRNNLTGLFDPAEDQVRYIADLIYNGIIDINDDKSLNEGLLAGLAASQRITGLVFTFPDYRVKVADRRTREVYDFVNTDDPITAHSIEEMKSSRVGSWSRLLYAPDAGETVMSFRQPVSKDNVYIGSVIAAIPISAVNKAAKKDGLQTDEGRFILYGKDHVLTQQGFQVDSTSLTYEGVVPKLSEIDDPVLASIWTAPRTPFRIIKSNLGFEGHFTIVNGERYQFFYSNLEGYTDQPLIIGYHLKYDEATKEIRRLGYAAMTGIIILGISILIAFFIGRKISRPIVALSKASQKISSLEFDKVDPLPPSRLKELNEASDGYNTMLRGLSWFENYVPKSLVRKLMESGDAHSETRDVTVMFTDIVAFTPMAENMASEEVADLLNTILNWSQVALKQRAAPLINLLAMLLWLSGVLRTIKRIMRTGLAARQKQLPVQSLTTTRNGNSRTRNQSKCA
ncbi:MAG: adenylate/guanylate cyclase domain-containing protein [Sneathiella sp.]|nr:adenylate/guanylate cyclase domain-containing protein [Sneathiella sp.]